MAFLTPEDNITAWPMTSHKSPNNYWTFWIQNSPFLVPLIYVMLYGCILFTMLKFDQQMFWLLRKTAAYRAVEGGEWVGPNKHCGQLSPRLNSNFTSLQANWQKQSSCWLCFFLKTNCCYSVCINTYVFQDLCFPTYYDNDSLKPWWAEVQTVLFHMFL